MDQGTPSKGAAGVGRWLRRAMCVCGWHKWNRHGVWDISPISGSVIERPGRTCSRCDCVQWQPSKLLGWTSLDICSHYDDVRRRTKQA